MEIGRLLSKWIVPFARGPYLTNSWRVYCYERIMPCQDAILGERTLTETAL